jgi:hypothetical protein
MIEQIKSLPPHFLIAGGIIILLIILQVILRILRINRKIICPYKSAHSLLTTTELKFYNELESAIGNRYHICMKVRLEDIIQVSGKFSNKERWSHRGRIKSRHIDFILCNKKTLSVCYCIELDDKSHNRKDRKERDQFVDWALKGAGVSITHIKTAPTYSIPRLKNMFP